MIFLINDALMIVMPGCKFNSIAGKKSPAFQRDDKITQNLMLLE